MRYGGLIVSSDKCRGPLLEITTNPTNGESVYFACEHCQKIVRTWLTHAKVEGWRKEIPVHE